MHIQDEGSHGQGVMEQDNVLRLLFDCAVSAAVPPSSPPLVCCICPCAGGVLSLSLYKSYSVFERRGVFVFFFKQVFFFSSALGTAVLWRNSLYF